MKSNNSTNIFKKEKEFWDQKGDIDYNPYSENDFLLLMDSIKSLGVSGKSLEIACGSSALGKKVKTLSDHKVYGIDIAIGLLKKNKGFVACGDALKLPFKDNSFEMIFGTAALHHFTEIELSLSEIYRCLKKNGKIFFVSLMHTIFTEKYLWIQKYLREIFIRQVKRL